VALIVQQKRMTPELQKTFDQVLAQKNKLSDINAQINLRKQESDQISADQARIRENMKALKGSTEERTLLQRYTGELNAQEDRLAALRKESSDLQAQKAKASDDLDNMIMNINLDEHF
jgi:septal ring factor EnvC (AmiA/AmiB activator)